jgi:hypothetical protein
MGEAADNFHRAGTNSLQSMAESMVSGDFKRDGKAELVLVRDASGILPRVMTRE